MIYSCVKNALPAVAAFCLEASAFSLGNLPAKERWSHLSPDKVKIGGEIGRRIDLTLTNNLLKVDHDEVFLNAFSNKVSKPGMYFAAGKTLDALVAYAKYSGREDVVSLKKRFRDVIVDNQEPGGYIGAYQPPARSVRLWDFHEQGYILQALVEDASVFGERKSYEAAVRLGDYLISAWKKVPADWGSKYVGRTLASLGMPQAMVKLHSLTGGRRYLDFAVDVWGLGEWNDPIVRGRDELVLGHVYAYLAFCLGQQDLYRISPDEKYLRATKKAMETVFDGGAAVVTGEVGVDECWCTDQNGGPGLGETCTGVYLMFNYDSLLRLGAGDASRLGDAMERTLYNAIFAAQSADGRWIRYYTPLLGKRKYFELDGYCCPANFRRLISRLPGYALYRGEDGVMANLYTSCDAVVEISGVPVGIRETTAYPADGRIDFELSLPKPLEFGFTLRIPRWCGSPGLAVNGESAEAPEPGTLKTLRRRWKNGDRITLNLPMAVRRVRGHAKQSGMFAVMRGPLVYGLNGRRIMRRSRVAPGDGSDAFALQCDGKAMSMSFYELANALRIDPRHLDFSREKETSFRPDGTKIMTHVSIAGGAVGVSRTSDPVCILTEFADPDNEITFFRMPGWDSPLLVEDEIFRYPLNQPR
jgi:hypothetical protein